MHVKGEALEVDTTLRGNVRKTLRLHRDIKGFILALVSTKPQRWRTLPWFADWERKILRTSREIRVLFRSINLRDYIAKRLKEGEHCEGTDSDLLDRVDVVGVPHTDGKPCLLGRVLYELFLRQNR